ncbi:hypothetical protein ACWCQZ_10395 [Streptomyces sp. NPDC002285]
MTHFEPQDRVLVSPRHLAGAGIDRLADAIGPLIHLFGWPSEHERATGRITVSNPDGSLFVNFNSRHTQGRWWSTERRRRGVHPLHQPPTLSPAQDAALRAIAQGEVTIADDKPYIRRDEARVSISTIRSLESRGLVTREPCLLWLRDERVHLTTDGCHGLAATFGRPRPPALTATRPASRPAATVTRAATR